MKKFLIFVLMALAVMSCNRHPQSPATKNASTISKVDMVVLQHGQMLFYDYATQQLTPYEAEKDSVVNVAFDNDNHLYYTTAKQQDLTLKTIDLSEADPQPVPVFDWKLTLDLITDNMFGTGAVNLELDSEGMLYMPTNSYFAEQPFDVEAFNIVTGEAYELSYSEYMEMFHGQESLDRDHFYNDQYQFYHATPEGNICLNDKIDFKTVFEIYDLSDLFFYPLNESPDGQNIVYSALIELGEGWGHYCIASSDGQKQNLLKDSDTWTMAPAWLADGTLVYVGQEPRPENDPSYDEDWNNTRHCVKIMNSNGEASILVSDADRYFVNPIDLPQAPKKERQADFETADMAIIDQGKVIFYDSEHNTLIPFVAEEDFVVNGVFGDYDAFYYTVAIGDELYLKRVYLGYFRSSPDMLTDWNLKLSDCYGAEDDLAAPMFSYSNVSLIRMDYELYEEFGEFINNRYYNYDTRTMTDEWPDDINLGDGFDDWETQFMNDQDLFEQIDDTQAEEEDKSYYYYIPDPAKDTRICISCNIDFDSYKTSEYSYEPQFEFLGIGPNRDCVVYAAPVDWGHVGHGPLCYATLDGKVQMAFDNTDVTDVCYGWLSDGRLAYSDNEGIKAVAPDGSVTLISTSKRFVTVK